MELSQAISQAIKEFGKDIITEPRFVNILADYGAFQQAPFARSIIRDLISDGFMYRILAKIDNYTISSVERDELTLQILKIFPFRKEAIDFVIKCLLSHTILPTNNNNTTYINDILNLNDTKSERKPSIDINSIAPLNHIILNSVDKSVIDYNIPANTIEIGDFCFEGCNELKKISLPGSVLAIGKCAFAHCKQLKAISLSLNTNFIGDSCFENDSLLTNISLPSTVKYIGKKCFEGCNKLKVVYIASKDPDSIHIEKDSFGDKVARNCVLHVPPSSIGRYLMHPIFQKFSYIVESKTSRRKQSVNQIVGSLPAKYKTSKDFSHIGHIELGQTTLSQAEKLGYNIEKLSDLFKTHRYINTRFGSIWEFRETNVLNRFSSSLDHKIPQEWYNLGIRKYISYNELINLFKDWGFHVVIEEAPKTEVFSNRKVLKASLYAYAMDMSICFYVSYNYGNANGEGYTCDSPNSLHYISASVNFRD